MKLLERSYEESRPPVDAAAKRSRFGTKAGFDEVMMRVLIAAPPGLYGDALCNLVAKLRTSAQCMRFHGIETALESAVGATFNLIVIDIDAPDGGAAAVQRCATRFPGAPIIAATSSVEADFVGEILDAGAMGYLPKHYTEPLALGVMNLVLDGASYRPHVKSNGNSSKQSSATFKQIGITERQAEVLALMVQGLPNAEIAKRLDIREGTTRLHVSAILRALNVQNRSEAIVVALRMRSVNLLQARQGEDGKLDLRWLLPHMSDVHYKKGTVVFNKGEPGNALYYLQQGNVVLKEFNLRMGPGSLFGEIGIFAPGHKRTATAQCESDATLLTLTADHVKEIYALNPQFAFYVVHLMAGRLIADQARLV
jgi:DNA-binding NarL/FixJ family response regulator